MSKNDLINMAVKIENQMNVFAEDLDFEKAIEKREELKKINEILLQRNKVS
jgi:excinuclease ABC subunit B